MSIADTYVSVIWNYIIFAIMTAIFLKLLRLGKLSSIIFNSIVFIPFFSLIPLFIFSLSFGLLSTTVNSNSTKFYLSAAITISILVIYFANSLDKNYYLKDFTFKEKLKIKYESLKEQISSYFEKYFTSEIDIQKRNDHVEMFAMWDHIIKKESNDKLWYLFIAVIFYICAYFLLMNLELFEDLIDSLSAVQKYIYLISLLFLFLFLYNLYYMRYSKIIFSKLIDLISFLEREKKYVLVVDNPIRKGTYNYVIVKYHPWKNKTSPNYYFFTHTKEMNLAYWMNSQLDFRHYKNVTFAFSRYGVEGFLDFIVSKSDKNRK
jgi:hypothetical protein